MTEDERAAIVAHLTEAIRAMRDGEDQKALQAAQAAIEAMEWADLPRLRMGVQPKPD